jgi:hypothetical protein
MTTKYDIKVWRQMLTEVRAANARMRQRINNKEVNGFVIVSNTFDHCVGSDENNCATAEVIAFSTQPVVLRKANAERLARDFKAYCGPDERRIYWHVMNALQYYERLITRNENMIELLEDTLAKHPVAAI